MAQYGEKRIVDHEDGSFNRRGSTIFCEAWPYAARTECCNNVARRNKSRDSKGQRSWSTQYISCAVQKTKRKPHRWASPQRNAIKTERGMMLQRFDSTRHLVLAVSEKIVTPSSGWCGGPLEAQICTNGKLRAIIMGSTVNKKTYTASSTYVYRSSRINSLFRRETSGKPKQSQSKTHAPTRNARGGGGHKQKCPFHRTAKENSRF